MPPARRARPRARTPGPAEADARGRARGRCVRAALNPIRGRDKILRFTSGRHAKQFVPTAVRRVRINGLPGYLLQMADGPETMAFEIADGLITAIYDVRNPDKLSHLAQGA